MDFFFRLAQHIFRDCPEMAYFGAGPVLWAERLVRKKCWILSSRMVYGRRHQREEVVHISDSYQGTLEVAGR